MTHCIHLIQLNSRQTNQSTPKQGYPTTYHIQCQKFKKSHRKPTTPPARGEPTLLGRLSPLLLSNSETNRASVRGTKSPTSSSAWIKKNRSVQSSHGSFFLRAAGRRGGGLSRAHAHELHGAAHRIATGVSRPSRRRFRAGRAGGVCRVPPSGPSLEG